MSETRRLSKVAAARRAGPGHFRNRFTGAPEGGRLEARLRPGDFPDPICRGRPGGEVLAANPVELSPPAVAPPVPHEIDSSPFVRVRGVARDATLEPDSEGTGGHGRRDGNSVRDRRFAGGQAGAVGNPRRKEDVVIALLVIGLALVVVRLIALYRSPPNGRRATDHPDAGWIAPSADPASADDHARHHHGVAAHAHSHPGHDGDDGGQSGHDAGGRDGGGCDGGGGGGDSGGD